MGLVVIEDWQANVTDLEIRRPVRLGPGVDTSGPPVVIATGLSAIYSGKKRAVRTVNGREVQITASFVIDPVDNNGDPIDVRPFDQLTYTDFRGRRQKPQQIEIVTPWYACAEVDHIELEIS